MSSGDGRRPPSMSTPTPTTTLTQISLVMFTVSDQVRITPANTAPVMGLMLSSAAWPSTSTSIERISVPATCPISRPNFSARPM